MKVCFRGKYYASDKEVKTAVMKLLKEQSIEFYKTRIHTFIRRWNITIEKNGVLLRSLDVIHRGPASFWCMIYVSFSVDTRLTKAWDAIDRLSIIWKSDLTDKMKRSFFHAGVVSILLYGCTTWTLTNRLEKKLDGNYTKMLPAILNKSWRQHPTRHQLYGHLPPITNTIQVRRTGHAGHCWRSKDELIWPNKSRTTSWNINTTAMWGYGM